MRSPFSIKWIYLIEWRSFGQKYKFSNKNDMVSAWRNFQNIFSRPLFTIIFRPEMLKFHQYSILSGEAMVGFVIYCVLKYKSSKGICKNQVDKGLKYRLPKVAHVSVPPLTLYVFWQNIFVVFLFTRQFGAEKILVLGIWSFVELVFPVPVS